MNLKIIVAWTIITILIANLILFATKIISNQIFWMILIILAGISYLGFKKDNL